VAYHIFAYYGNTLLQVKLTYRKAMLVVHPDRTTGTNADQQFAGKRIFEAINEAYAYFLEHESP
jgi:curved DNA-binding protein CbpA